MTAPGASTHAPAATAAAAGDPADRRPYPDAPAASCPAQLAHLPIAAVLPAARPPPPHVPPWTPVAATIAGVVYRASGRSRCRQGRSHASGASASNSPRACTHIGWSQRKLVFFFSSERVIHLHSAGFQGILARSSLARGRLAKGAVKRNGPLVRPQHPNAPQSSQTRS
jgi:hypothetical protein